MTRFLTPPTSGVTMPASTVVEITDYERGHREGVEFAKRMKDELRDVLNAYERGKAIVIASDQERVDAQIDIGREMGKFAAMKELRESKEWKAMHEWITAPERFNMTELTIAKWEALREKVENGQ